MKTTHFLMILAAVILVSIPAAAAEPGFHDEIKRGKEKELRVKLDAAMGKVKLCRVGAPYLFVSDLEPHGMEGLAPDIHYSISGSTGILDVSTDFGHGHRHSYNFDFSTDMVWDIKLSDAVPVLFKGELGAGSGDFDFTGIRLRSFDLETGASSVTIRFNEPNPVAMDRMRIESGVSKFEGVNLGFANFRTMTFKGGVGSYMLNFYGVEQPETDVDIEQGIGSITILVPSDVGVKIDHSGSFLSKLHAYPDISERSDDEYFSNNYESAAKKMYIKIESALGSVTVQHK